MAADAARNIVIRVARAIANTQGSTDWWNNIGLVRSAIGAMREPSFEMPDAVLEGLPDWGTLPDDWRAMIDHVLETSHEHETDSDMKITPTSAEDAGVMGTAPSS